MTHVAAVPGTPAGRIRKTSARAGQTTVEFAVASIVFLLVVIGTIDVGRAIFKYSELTNAVREGARYGKFAPGDTAGIKRVVVERSPSLGLSTGSVDVSCSGSCEPVTDRLVVSARFEFAVVPQALLGVSPITIGATASVTVE